MNSKFIAFNLLCFFFLVLFVKLGIWQMHRLHWKTNLIQMVSNRLAQAPIDAPRKPTWPRLKEDDIAYLPVKLYGHFLDKPAIYVTSVNDGQTGYWQMALFQRDDKSLIFINRGFIPMDLKNSSGLRPIDSQDHWLQGILRLNENTYRFLYKNYLIQNKWYRRNIAQMAQKLGLPKSDVAPFFIDEAKHKSGPKYPLGGLTTINFPNSHLSYAVTWFGLALGVLGAMIFLFRSR